MRVLRVLFRHGGALNASDIAARASLSRPAAGQALADLVRQGLVESVNPGRFASYRTCTTHPLAPSLARLFQDEESRTVDLIEELRRRIEEARPRPLGAWLYGSVARAEDVLESDLDIVVLVASAKERKGLEGPLRDSVLQVGERFDVSPSLVFLTEHELLGGLRQGTRFYHELARDGVQIAGVPRMIRDLDG